MISPPHRSARRGGCSRNALLSSQTTGAEEFAKQSGRLRGTCFVLNDFGAPVTGRLFEKSWPVQHCPALFVSRSKDQPPDPREADRAGAQTQADYVSYDQARLEALRGEGKTILVNMTAD